MAVNNSLAPKAADKPKDENKLSVYLGKEGVKAKLLETLGDPKALKIFTSSITAAVSHNPSLQKCDIATVVSAGIEAVALGLPISPTLGCAHLIPFADSKNDRIVATFVIGYKGYKQLALRSGFYKKIIVSEVKEGELIKYDPFTEEIILNSIENSEEREKAEEIGYYGAFELLNGYTKKIYWPKKKMLKHADRYVPAFSLEATTGKYPKVSYADYLAGKYPKNTEWLYSSKWYSDFTSMALKTIIRQLISKEGIMSIEMQEAYIKDTEAMAYEDKQAFDFVPPQEQATEEFFDEQAAEKEKKPAKAKAKKEEPQKTDDADDDFFGDNPFPEDV